MTDRIKATNVRMTFNHLTQPTDFQGNGDFQYSATFLVEKGSPNEKAIEAALANVAKIAWPKTWQKDLVTLKAQGAMKCCFVDGDDTGKDGYGGHMVLSAKRKQADGRPAVAARDGSPVNPGDPGAPYGGCSVVASVEIYAQDNQFGKGLRCGLRGVQFFRDGPAFGGAAPVNAESEFAALAEEFADLV